MSLFEPIPVMDLMGGLVVRARGGERDSYRPLEGSHLVADPDPFSVVDGLLSFHPFRTLYIADLDAIRGKGGHAALILELTRRYQNLEIWVDAGFATPGECAAMLATTDAHLVIGSESQGDIALLEGLAGEERVVLSLDTKGEQRLGPAELFERPELWPQRIIAMTLARVGGGAGPDLERIAGLKALCPDATIYGAGGVRDAHDLDAVASAGAAGVLIASALHDGRITAPELARFELPPRPKPAPRPKFVRTTIELPEKADRELEAAAQRRGVTKSDLVREVVEDMLRHEPREPEV